MMWVAITFVISRFVAPLILARIVCVLIGWGTASLEELLSLSVFVGFIAGHEVGGRRAVFLLALSDFNRERDAR